MSVESIHQKIIACENCDRLRQWCQKVSLEKRKSFMHETYWGKPVPSFGDSAADLFIVGLAPAAHGANRTGRMFTGDNSGLWLYKALFEHGYANRPESKSSHDDLILSNAYITAVVHCAPPDNQPTIEELNTCINYLHQELDAMKNIKVILALGSVAWNAIYQIAKERKWVTKKEKFGHGVIVQLGPYQLIGSYHPSQQNTFTKRLTKEMFDAVFLKIRKMLNSLK